MQFFYFLSHNRKLKTNMLDSNQGYNILNKWNMYINLKSAISLFLKIVYSSNQYKIKNSQKLYH